MLPIFPSALCVLFLIRLNFVLLTPIAALSDGATAPCV